MNKIKRLACCALAAASVFVFGGWTQNNTAPAEDRYADAPTYSTYSTETVYFTSKQTDTKFNAAPNYRSLSGLTNACGPVAGAEVIGYYDKYYEDMIPNWQSYFPTSGKYRSQDNVYVPGIINDFYTRMRTNVEGPGVTATDYVNALTQYIRERGHTAWYQNVLINGTVDFSACKTAINNNKVIVLLTRATDVYRVKEYSSYDTIDSLTIGASHIMIASGYHEVSYYNGSTLIRTDRYLYGSSGSTGLDSVYYKVDPHSLNYAYTVNID